MTLPTTAPALLAMIALMILAHGWQKRILGDPVLLSVIGWVINIVAIIMMVVCWYRIL